MAKSPIITNEDRENSGAISANRFSFQVNWGVCQLIDNFSSTQPFCLVLEKHEDALVCDDAESPSYIDFYQIKTRKGKNWRVSDLVALKDSKSIVSKMFHSKDLFGTLARKLSFRSDALFEFKNKKGTDSIIDKFHLPDLSTAQYKKIVKAIEVDYSIDSTVKIDDLFEFVTELIKYDNHIETTKGIMSDFFSKELEKPFHTMAYTFIAGEVMKKNNYEGAIIENTDLMKLKTVTKKEFLQWIELCVRRIKTKDDELEELKSELKEAKIQFMKRKKILEQVTNYLTRLKGGDSLIVKLKSNIQSEIGKYSTFDGNAYDCAILIIGDHSKKFNLVSHLPKEFLLAAIIYELII